MASTVVRGNEIAAFGATVSIIFCPDAPSNLKVNRLRRPLPHPPLHNKAFCTSQPPRQIGLNCVKYISFRRRVKTDIKANKILYSILEKVTV